MAITRGQKSTAVSSTAATTQTTSWGTNPAAGSTVIVWVWATQGTDADPSSVQDNGTTPTTFTKDAFLRNAQSSLNSCWVYRASSITLPSSGAYHVTVTF